MNSSGKAIGTIVWLILAMIGLWGVWQRITTGHQLAAYGSYVTWGLFVSAYIYFIGLSAGAFLLAAVVYGFSVEPLKKLGKLSLFTALVTLVMALLAISSDLGHVTRAYEVLVRPNFHSMMAWMVWMYLVYAVLLVLAVWFALRPDLIRWEHEIGWKGAIGRIFSFGRTEYDEVTAARDRRILRVLGVLGVPLAIAFDGGVAALFSTVLARPYWQNASNPVMFLTGALLSGGALVTGLVAWLWPRNDPDYSAMVMNLGRIVLGLLILDTLFEWAEFSVPMWYGIGPEYEILRQVLTGEYWYNFWIVHYAIGVVLPLVCLIAWRRSPGMIGLGCALIALTFLSVRLNIVIPALVTPELRGLEQAYIDKRLVFEYLPSFFEWALLSFIVALGSSLFFLGKNVLPLIPSEQEVS